MFQDKADALGLLLGFDPVLEKARVLIAGVVEMEYEYGGVGMFSLDLLQQFDDLGRRNGAAGLAQIDIVLILWTGGTQNVEPFAAATDADVEALSTPEPATKDSL